MILDILSFQWAGNMFLPAPMEHDFLSSPHGRAFYIGCTVTLYQEKRGSSGLLRNLAPHAKSKPREMKKEQERSFRVGICSMGCIPTLTAFWKKWKNPILPISSVTWVCHTAASSWPSLDGAGTLSHLDPYCLYTFQIQAGMSQGLIHWGFCCIFCNNNTVWDRVYCPQELAPARSQQQFPPWCRPPA